MFINFIHCFIVLRIHSPAQSIVMLTTNINSLESLLVFEVKMTFIK